MREFIISRSVQEEMIKQTKKMIWVEWVMTTMELRLQKGIKDSRNVNKWVKVTVYPSPSPMRDPFSFLL